MTRRKANSVTESVVDERMETIGGIRRGLESLKAKRGMRADKFFAEFFARNDIAEER